MPARNTYIKTASGWELIGSSSYMNALDDVGDVTISSVGDNEILAYEISTSQWVNQTLAETGIAEIDSPTFTGTVTSPMLRLTATDEVTNVSTTHPFQIGPTAGANLRLDVNEVHAIDNGTYTTLLLNEAGGNINVGSSSATVSIPGTTNANIINATNINFTSATLGTTGTQNLDFSLDAYKTMANITGTTTFTASSYGIGRTVTVRIINGSTTTARTINFPAGWVFVGPKPTTISASKTGILTITSFGTTEADCVASWAVQV